MMMNPAIEQMRQIVNAFLRYRAATVKPASYTNDIHALRPLQEYLETNPPATNPRELMIGYLAWLKQRRSRGRYTRGAPIAQATIATNAQRAFQACRWAVEEGYLDSMPLKSKELPKQPPPRPEPLTPDELRRVFSHLDDLCRLYKWWIDFRNRAMVIAFLETGCRVSELAQFTRGDFEQGYADVIQKGGRPHRVLLTSPALEAISEYLRAYTAAGLPPLAPSEQLWRADGGQALTVGGIRIIIQRIGKRAGVHLYPHRFRDTSATLRLAAGAPTEVVRRALGHSTERMLRHYVQLADSQQRALMETTSPMRALLWEKNTSQEVK